MVPLDTRTRCYAGLSLPTQDQTFPATERRDQPYFNPLRATVTTVQSTSLQSIQVFGNRLFKNVCVNPETSRGFIVHQSPSPPKKDPMKPSEHSRAQNTPFSRPKTRGSRQPPPAAARTELPPHSETRGSHKGCGHGGRSRAGCRAGGGCRGARGPQRPPSPAPRRAPRGRLPPGGTKIRAYRQLRSPSRLQSRRRGAHRRGLLLRIPPSQLSAVAARLSPCAPAASSDLISKLPPPPPPPVRAGDSAKLPSSMQLPEPSRAAASAPPRGGPTRPRAAADSAPLFLLPRRLGRGKGKI